MKLLTRFLFGFLVFATIANAQTDGTLDVTFDTDGMKLLYFSSTNSCGAQKAVLQSDNKILLVGYTHNGSDYDMGLIRLNTDGTVDFSRTYDNGGMDNIAYSVAVDGGGNIYVAGRTSDGFGSFDVMIVKLNSSGTLVSGFGTNGVLVTSLSYAVDEARDIQIDASGKLIIAGRGTATAGGEGFLLARFNSADGSLDTGFGTDGIVIEKFANADYATSMKIQTSGNIILGGVYGASINQWGLMSFSSTGAIQWKNSSINTGTAQAWINDIALDGSDNIYAVGPGGDLNNDNFCVGKFTSSGSLVTSFDTDGLKQTDVSGGSISDDAYSLAIQSDGKIIVTGTTDNSTKFALTRYNSSDGSLDATFGTSGIQKNNISGATNAVAQSMVIQTVGSNYYLFSFGNGDNNLALARYTNSNAPLPVELSNFTAKVIGSVVMLDWQTATEVNNYGFNVERASSSLGMTWEKIGFVQGHGNSNSPKSYSFEDNHPLSGKVQYRLKQIDFDGKFEYSDIVEVNFDTPNKYELAQNFPNPFNPTTVIEFAIPNSGRYTLSIFNVLGELVEVISEKEYKAGYYKETFNAKELSSGIYFYRLMGDQTNIVRKMTLIR